MASLVELAEAASIPVMDLGGALNFPNTHPMDVTGTNVLESADLIVMMDVDQPEVSLVARERYPRGRGRSRVKAGAKVVSVGLSDLLIRSTTVDFGSLYPFDLNIAADTSLAPAGPYRRSAHGLEERRGRQAEGADRRAQGRGEEALGRRSAERARPHPDLPRPAGAGDLERH